jgi:Secretion system C-terminal sorting domain
MKKCLSLFLVLLLPQAMFAQITKQQMCGRRTFYSYTSFNQASIGHQLYANDVLDSMKIYWGDGTNFVQIGSATGQFSHTYPQATNNYMVKMELWGKDPINQADSFHCSFTDTVHIVNAPTADTCSIDWREEWNGNTLSVSNTSHIYSSSYLQYKDPNGMALSLWDFGNGTLGAFANRIHDIEYAPGTYLICHRVGGFSFNNNGYIFNCNTCKQVSLFATDIKDEVPLMISLSPNPANSFCDLSSSQSIQDAKIQITDLFGHVIEPEIRNTSNFNKRIITSSLPSGIYLITMSNNGVRVNSKFVKQ